MADRLRMAVVLAVGSAVVGGPEALRLLVSVAGRNAAVDFFMCVFLICAFTALVLGTLLLALYFRVARPAAAPPAPAPGTELFAAVTTVVALAAMFMVTTSLVAIPTVPAEHGRGLDGAARSCFA